jgi:hypothetical protein
MLSSRKHNFGHTTRSRSKQDFTSTAFSGGGFGDLISGKFATRIKNMIPSSDANAAPSFEGEKHAILKLGEGSYGIGNYIGPGTQLLKRLNRGDKPRSEVDKVAKAHDIRYNLATDLSDIRRADNIMIKKVDEISRNRSDYPQNIAQAKLIKLKKFGEDIGVIKKSAFSGDLTKMNRETSVRDKTLLKSQLIPLAQAGYGLRQFPTAPLTESDQDPFPLPGDELKMKLLKNLSKSKKKKFGGRGNIANFLVDQVLPNLVRQLGLNPKLIPSKTLKKVVNDSVKTNKIATTIDKLAKFVLPIITKIKMKQFKITTKNQSGSGIEKILKPHNAKLVKLLKSGFTKSLHQEMSGKGSNVSCKAQNFHDMEGSGFWSSFKKGFASVFKPFADIAAPLLDFAGFPEFGIPLAAVSSLL